MLFLIKGLYILTLEDNAEAYINCLKIFTGSAWTTDFLVFLIYEMMRATSVFLYECFTGLFSFSPWRPWITTQYKVQPAEGLCQNWRPHGVPGWNGPRRGGKVGRIYPPEPPQGLQETELWWVVILNYKVSSCQTQRLIAEALQAVIVFNFISKNIFLKENK